MNRILQKELESLDDASTELMMISGNTEVLLTMGEAFFEIPEEEATEYCEKLVEEYQAQVDALQQEEDAIRSEQAKLKQILYGRFGKSINLEE
jgi:prefoldin subunit 4